MQGSFRATHPPHTHKHEQHRSILFCTEWREDLGTLLLTLFNYITPCLTQQYDNTKRYHNKCKQTNMETKGQQLWLHISDASIPSVVAFPEKWCCQLDLVWFLLTLFQNSLLSQLLRFCLFFLALFSRMSGYK